MPAPTTNRPNASAMPGGPSLLERAGALDAIAAALTAAQHGEGAALLLEGHAGMGKTRLHGAAIDRARARGLQVFRAAGAERECNLAFGVAGQVLRSLLTSLSRDERAAILATAPMRVLSLTGAGDAPTAGATNPDLTVAQGLFSILAQACERAPALLALDDLHLCDAASLEFLLYVVHRLHELPLSVVMTRRPRPGDATPDVLDHIAAHPLVQVLSLAPLGTGAVSKLVHASLRERADSVLVDVCTEVTGGNPFYLHELLLALADTPEAGRDELARGARRLAPDAVIRSLRVRVGRLGPAAAGLARAVAILGDDVPLRRAAALAGLSAADAAPAADKLAEAEVLMAREPLSFVHPLVRQAIEVDVPAAERATRHLDAARLLHREGADAEHVAAHLLLGRAEGDPWAVVQLCDAAQTALARSAPQSAARYLQRALEEPPEPGRRVDVLAQLGRAEAAAGLPGAVEHLERAIAAAQQPRGRAELALSLGGTLYAQSLYERAARAYDAGLAELGDEPADGKELALHDELQTGFIAAASIVPALHAESAARSAGLLPRALRGPRSHGQRLLLAQAATHLALGGEPAGAVQQMAEQAWDGGRLLVDEGPGGIGWSLVTAALCLSGDLERCLEVSKAVVDAARAEPQPLAYATACYVRALPLLWQGQVAGAITELEQARDARRYGWRQFTRITAGVYALCLIDTGEHEPAETALTEEGDLDAPRDLEDIFRLFVLGRLRLAQGRAAEALELALRVGQAAEKAGVRALGYAPWRELAAQASQAVGEDERALELAREAHELAESSGVLHARIHALRLLGITQPGERGLHWLQAACELGQAGPPRLEWIRALVDLGAALRRANRRAAARECLQRAADLALQGGARALFTQARTELAASGGRPRRELLLSGPESLTPSERRIAELAVAGHSNREIARTLFVTPKTVEYHLRNVYRKLDIERRRELAQALGS